MVLSRKDLKAMTPDPDIIVTYEGKELTEEEFIHRLFANFHSDHPAEVMMQALLEDETRR